VVQRPLQPTIRPPPRTCGRRQISPNTRFVEIEVFGTATSAADHGVVRDYAAAFVDISQLRASCRFVSGLAKVVDHSVVQRPAKPTIRPPPRACGSRPICPKTLFVEFEVFGTATPAADHGVVRDYAAAFIDISQLRASRRFVSGLAVTFHVKNPGWTELFPWRSRCFTGRLSGVGHSWADAHSLSYLRRMSSGASVEASIAEIVSRTLLAFIFIRCGGKSFSSFSK
jgi:hypothetical protein